MEALDAEIDLLRETVRFRLGDGSIRASLLLLNEGIYEMGDESAEF